MHTQLPPKHCDFIGQGLVSRQLLGLTRTLGLGGLLASVALGCSGNSDDGGGLIAPQGGSVAQIGGSAATGGSGSPTSGGAATGNGGAVANGGNSPANGGSASGGAPANGGTPSVGGGASTGGTKTTGGAATNGGTSAKGGATTGGASPNGGTSNGGTSNGGATTGGASSNGGMSNGGTATGGAAPKGGASTGGNATTGGTPSTGGTTTGGASPTGGTSTGGRAATGGSPGAGGTTSSANDLWIAPNGSDSNPGTEASPLATLTGAHSKVSAGQTIWVKTGTYSWSSTQKLTKSGSASSPINVFAASGARPVIDFSGQPRDNSSARGIQISGAYWHLKGFDVMKAGDNCIHISGSNNTIEWLSIHGCCDSGLQITDPTASNNTVLNCDSYENLDAANGGENADGFAAKLELGPGNVFRGCRAWNNSDDGWDLYAASGLVTIENSWAFLNGKPTTANGDGNGFKLGGAGGGAPHKVTNCFSIDNLACGFARNNNTEVPVLSQCGGKGDGKGTLCSLTNSSPVSFTMTSAQAKAVTRNADGSLPAIN